MSCEVLRARESHLALAEAGAAKQLGGLLLELALRELAAVLVRGRLVLERRLLRGRRRRRRRRGRGLRGVERRRRRRACAEERRDEAVAVQELVLLLLERVVVEGLRHVAGEVRRESGDRRWARGELGGVAAEWREGREGDGSQRDPLCAQEVDRVVVGDRGRPGRGTARGSRRVGEEGAEGRRGGRPTEGLPLIRDATEGDGARSLRRANGTNEPRALERARHGAAHLPREERATAAAPSLSPRSRSLPQSLLPKAGLHAK